MRPDAAECKTPSWWLRTPITHFARGGGNGPDDCYVGGHQTTPSE